MLQALVVTLLAGGSLLLTGFLALLVFGGVAGASGMGAAYLFKRRRDRDEA